MRALRALRALRGGLSLSLSLSLCRTGAERGDLIGREVEAVVVAVARKRQPVPKGK